MFLQFPFSCPLFVIWKLCEKQNSAQNVYFYLAGKSLLVALPNMRGKIFISLCHGYFGVSFSLSCTWRNMNGLIDTYKIPCVQLLQQSWCPYTLVGNLHFIRLHKGRYCHLLPQLDLCCKAAIKIYVASTFALAAHQKLITLSLFQCV